MVKKILVVALIVIVFMVGGVGAKGPDEIMIRRNMSRYLDYCYSTLFYKKNDKILKWHDEITIQIFGLPDDLNGVYRNSVSYFNRRLAQDNVSIKTVDDGNANIKIFVSNDISKIARTKLRKILKENSQSDDGYDRMVGGLKDDGAFYFYRKDRNNDIFIVLWNPSKFPQQCIADKSPRFQLQKILFYTLTFVPSSTKSNKIVLGEDNIYPVTHIDMSYLVALYKKNVCRFAELKNVKHIMLDNIVGYLSSVKK